MRSKQQLIQDVLAAIDASREKIIGIGTTVWKNPEPGYKEFKTSDLAAKTLTELGLSPKRKLSITGMRADLIGAKPGPSLAICGEMDSLILPSHPECDPATGAVHACGHNSHIATMLGAAIGLVQANAQNDISGKVAFIPCPAEECIEIEWRNKLIKEGKIADVIKQQLNDLISFNVDKVLMPETKGGETYQVKFDVIASINEHDRTNYSTEPVADGRSLTYAAGDEPTALTINGEVWQFSYEISEIEQMMIRTQNKIKGFGGMIGGSAPSSINKTISKVNNITQKVMGYVDLVEGYADYAKQFAGGVGSIFGFESSYVEKIQKIKEKKKTIQKGHLPCSFKWCGHTLFKPNLVLDEDNFTYSNKESGMSSFVAQQTENDFFGSVEGFDFSKISEMTSAGLNVM